MDNHTSAATEQATPREVIANALCGVDGNGFLCDCTTTQRNAYLLRADAVLEIIPHLGGAAQAAADRRPHRELADREPDHGQYAPLEASSVSVAQPAGLSQEIQDFRRKVTEDMDRLHAETDKLRTEVIAAQASPVAHRWRWKGDVTFNAWRYGEGPFTGSLVTAEVEPLYAAQPPAAPVETVTDGSIQEGDVLSYTMTDGVGKVTAHVRPVQSCSAGTAEPQPPPNCDEYSYRRGWSDGYNAAQTQRSAASEPVAYVPRSKAPGSEGEPLWREAFAAKWLNKGTWQGFDLMPLYSDPPQSLSMREALAEAWIVGHNRARGFSFDEIDIKGCKGSFLWGQAMFDAVALMPDGSEVSRPHQP